MLKVQVMLIKSKRVRVESEKIVKSVESVESFKIVKSVIKVKRIQPSPEIRWFKVQASQKCQKI